MPVPTHCVDAVRTYFVTQPRLPHAALRDAARAIILATDATVTGGED